MDEISEKFSGADPFQSWWPFVVALGVGVIMTIRLVRLASLFDYSVVWLVWLVQ